MARASMKDLVGKAAPLAGPAATTAAAPTEAKPAPAVRAAGADEARINFAIDRELRRRFKEWAAHNDTTIKDELTRHIEELLG